MFVLLAVFVSFIAMDEAFAQITPVNPDAIPTGFDGTIDDMFNFWFDGAASLGGLYTSPPISTPQNFGALDPNNPENFGEVDFSGGFNDPGHNFRGPQDLSRTPASETPISQAQSSSNTTNTPYGSITVTSPADTAPQPTPKSGNDSTSPNTTPSSPNHNSPRGVPGSDQGSAYAGDGINGNTTAGDGVKKGLTDALAAIKDALQSLGEKYGLLNPTGDPGVFNLKDGYAACTETREMGSHESNYWKLDLFTNNPPIVLNMDRNPCDENTMMIVFDFNQNGKVDNGLELLFSQQRNIFEMMAIVDEVTSIPDGVISESDYIWQVVRIGTMDNTYNMVLSTPEEHGIKGFVYSVYEKFEDDEYGVGVYADWEGVSSEHFRINSWNEYGVITETGSVPLYGSVLGALRDCTIHDVWYHVAEKHTGEYLRADELGIEQVNSIPIYVEAYEFCSNFAIAKANPDKYLSHWVAGVASMEHKIGFEDNSRYEVADKLYNIALTMSPNNPFYNVDHCILQFHMGQSTANCIESMEKAVEDRPDVEWFKEALVIAQRGNF